MDTGVCANGYVPFRVSAFVGTRADLSRTMSRGTRVWAWVDVYESLVRLNPFPWYGGIRPLMSKLIFTVSFIFCIFYVKYTHRSPLTSPATPRTKLITRTDTITGS